MRNSMIADKANAGDIRIGPMQTLEAEPEERFDRLTRLARRLFKAPMAGIVIGDDGGRWTKSCDGLSASEMLHASSLFDHIRPGQNLLFVPDILRDRRFPARIEMASLGPIRFYAEAPLLGGSGRVFGTLCVMDTAPRQPDTDDVLMLNELATMIEHELFATDQAKEDSLTGLPNRRGFELLAGKALRAARSCSERIGVLYFDLDGLNRINTQLGRGEGDRALRSFAQSLREVARPGDVLGRVGGDEFALMLRDCGSAECFAAADQVRDSLETAIRTSVLAHELRYSQGICVEQAEIEGVTVDSLLRRADASMFQQKFALRGRRLSAVG
jgi:diguanylate cyclase (GGDEF)-like protein